MSVYWVSAFGDNIQKFILPKNVVLFFASFSHKILSFEISLALDVSNLDLPFVYKLTHIHRKEMFHYNWQLNEDKTPYFIKYGYNWVFNGIPKDQRTEVMTQTWDLVKDNYV